MASEDLSLYTLFPATQEQTIEARKRAHVQWSRGVSVDGYLARESRLDSGEHARDGKHTAWFDLSLLNYKIRIISNIVIGS